MSGTKPVNQLQWFKCMLPWALKLGKLQHDKFCTITFVSSTVRAWSWSCDLKVELEAAGLWWSAWRVKGARNYSNWKNGVGEIGSSSLPQEGRCSGKDDRGGMRAKSWSEAFVHLLTYSFTWSSTNIYQTSFPEFPFSPVSPRELCLCPGLSQEPESHLWVDKNSKRNHHWSVTSLSPTSTLSTHKMPLNP